MLSVPLHFSQVQEQDVQQFQARATAMVQLQQAFKGNNLRQIAAAYQPLLDNYTKITQEERVLLKLAKTFDTAYTSDDDDQIAAAFKEAQQSPLYGQLVLALEEKRRINLALKRNEAVQKFRSALPSQIPRQLVDAYDPLVDSRLTAEEREQYRLALAYVQGYDDAEALVIAYDAIQHSPHCVAFVFTPEERERVKLARGRGQALAAFGAAMGQKKALHIVEAYEALPLNTNKYVPEQQKQLVASARRYVVMYQALQEIIRTQQEDKLLEIYEQDLAAQFSDMTPKECLYVENIVISRRLKQLLHANRYAEVLTMASEVADPSGKKISSELRQLLSNAMRQFIKSQDVTHATAYLERRRDGNHVVLRWSWPREPLIKDAVVTWSHRGWLVAPQEVQWLDSTWLHASRVRHQRERTVDILVGRHTYVYVQIYCAMRNEWDEQRKWCFSAGVALEVYNASVR